MNTTLLIMAAGIGSRFGTGIKQLEPVDASNHIIMDYSIHDAIEAGFNHVVFIIRKDIEKEFKEVIGDRIASICSSHNVTVDYAFQDIDDIPGKLPEGRTKPWGTGQAVLAAKNVIDTPFLFTISTCEGKKRDRKGIAETKKRLRGALSTMEMNLFQQFRCHVHAVTGVSLSDFVGTCTSLFSLRSDFCFSAFQSRTGRGHGLGSERTERGSESDNCDKSFDAFHDINPLT